MMRIVLYILIALIILAVIVVVGIYAIKQFMYPGSVLYNDNPSILSEELAIEYAGKALSDNGFSSETYLVTLSKQNPNGSWRIYIHMKEGYKYMHAKVQKTPDGILVELFRPL